ncbi:MAG: SOUL family heme-binding protein, partial [Steroidobacteraceae bacterium]
TAEKCGGLPGSGLRIAKRPQSTVDRRASTLGYGQRPGDEHAGVGQVEIAMTAPVTQQSAGEKIEMTAPVTQQAAGSVQRVAFVVPARFTPSTVPQPTDERVVIREWPARRVAVLRYGGRWTERNYDEALARLEAELSARGLIAAGPPTLARYDPPFKPWFMRRNEVWIPVEAKPD